MSNITKHALAESLKKLLLKNPLNKITINDLTTDCGISRMAFIIISKISTIWSNGYASKNPEELSRERKPMLPGRKDFCRFLKQSTKQTVHYKCL